jgi:alpha-N-arabinofuranosidase
MANIAQTVNVISPLTTSKSGILKQTTWWPLLIFSKYFRGHSLAVHVQCGEYEGETQPAWIRGSIETPWLDVSASLNDDGTVNLAVVNVHESQSFETIVEGILDGAELEIHTVNGGSVDDVNTAGKQLVGIERSSLTWTGSYKFPAHSLTVLRWAV